MGLNARLRGLTTVRMLSSVASPEHDLVAGEKYDLKPEHADVLIIRGYADGNVSRVYSPDEMAAIHESHQTVHF